MDEKDIWPDRYFVGAEAKRFYFGEVYWKSVLLNFRVFSISEEIKNSLNSIGYDYDDCEDYAKPIATYSSYTFSKKEAYDLGMFFSKPAFQEQKYNVFKKNAYLPKPSYITSCLRFMPGHYNDWIRLIRLSKEPGYDLQFEVYATFDLTKSVIIGTSYEEALEKEEAMDSLRELSPRSLEIVRESMDLRRATRENLISSIDTYILNSTEQELVKASFLISSLTPFIDDIQRSDFFE